MSPRSVTGFFALSIIGAATAACTVDATRDGVAVEEIASTHQALSSAPYLTRKTPPNLVGNQVPAALQEADAYYQQWNAPPTQSAFRDAFGFSAPGANVAGAAYYNRGDLGIGRVMHCTSQGAVQACYVENFGNFGGDEATALNDVAHRTNFLATVAMVFDPSKGASAVNFVVYDRNGNRQSFAQLDTVAANTAVPFNCSNCHGGNYDTGTHTMNGAHFLPFDVQSFGFADFNGYRQADQEDSLRALNAVAYNIAQQQNVPAITEVIDAWYGPSKVFTPGTKFFPDIVIKGWSFKGIDVDVYRKVIAPYCRSCHVASPVDLRDATTALGQITPDSCTAHTMPLAEIPTKRFWADAPSFNPTLAGDGQSTCTTPPDFLGASTGPVPPPPPPPPVQGGECRYRFPDGHVSNRDFFGRTHTCTRGSNRSVWFPQCRDGRNETVELGCF